ncbi:putative ribonuclease H-like domain-containing protein [Tanacetum coccineum]|uniref:Ribonuclease H-like domain-containing protein n=1 Tax=Tanacetum coccineum TaxID=301880 RepID=A0ABQ4XBD0_9ASTR
MDNHSPPPPLSFPAVKLPSWHLNFIRQIENQLNHRVKIIRSDNGTEFKNRDMLEFCRNKGIKQDDSNARTPQHNGVAERMNRTLIEAARTMLIDSLLPTTFWTEAVSKRLIHPLSKEYGKRWMFDIDYLTDSMNYIPVSLENQANPHAGASEVTNNAGTSQTPYSNASKEKDEDAELIVVPLTVKNTKEKVESRTSSTNSKKEEILTEPQQEKMLCSTDSDSNNPKISASCILERELEEIALNILGTSCVRDTKDIRIASNPFLRPYPHTILYHITDFDLAVNISQSFNWEDFLKYALLRLCCYLAEIIVVNLDSSSDNNNSYSYSTSQISTSEEIDYDSPKPPKSLLKWYHYLSDEYKDNGMQDLWSADTPTMTFAEVKIGKMNLRSGNTDNESTELETTDKRNTNKDCIVDSNSAMSKACTLHLQLAYAHCICTLHLQLAFASKHLHIAFADCICTLHLYIAFAACICKQAFAHCTCTLHLQAKVLIKSETS